MAHTRSTYKSRDLYQEVTDRIVTALEEGVAPWVCPWRRDGDGGRPRNGASGHIYKGVNILLTGMSGFASSRWYTYKQAQARGAHVRRGEKGTQVIYWRFIEAKGDEDKHGEDADRPARRIPILRCYSVFCAEQIEWPEGSKHAVQIRGDDQALDLDTDFEDARTLIKAAGADIKHGGTRAFYAPTGDYIRVPDTGRFQNTGDYHATVLHELAHWTGHENRLDRDLAGRFGDESYAAEELVAELAAAFLCADLGVPGQLQHAEYIGHWIKVLKRDKRAVFTASRMAQEAADYLIGTRDANTNSVGDGASLALEEAA